MLAVALLISLVLLASPGCRAKTGTTEDAQYYEVKRGDLDVIVSTDGSLSMPNQFDLRFGTTGTVKEILVEEGDVVHQGALLAFMDNTQQINAIRTALYNLYAAVYSGAPSLTVAIDGYANACSQYIEIPKGYPELTAPRIFEEAQKDLAECIDYFEEGLYRDAGLKLALAYSDIKVCEKIIESKIDASVYAGAKPNSIIKPEGSAGMAEEMSEQDVLALGQLEDFREKILHISDLIMHGDYTGASLELDLAGQEMINLRKEVENTVHHNKDTSMIYADTPTSLNFLQSSMRLLGELDTFSSREDATPEEVAKRLIIARLNLGIASDVLEEQTLAYGWGSGFNWKQLQTYNLNVQAAEIAFYRAKQDLANTVIVAPSDGTVVSVDLKENYILSAQDYSTRTAIKLVDTGIVKFTGMIDEIDIFKVDSGQKATISVDAITDKKFTGTVKFISPFGTAVGKVIKFAVTIVLDPTDIELRGSLSATADIESYRAEDVILVPVSAILTTPTASMVIVLNPSTGQTEPRRVTIGRQNLQWVEVLSGLEEGEKIQQNTNIEALPSFTPGGGMPIRIPR